MRLAWGAVAVACLLAGLWLMLRTLGLVEVVLHGASHWWPALLLAAGVAILLRSVKPSPNIAVAVGLMAAGCIAFAITNVVIAERVWIFVAAGGLIIIGLISTRIAASPRAHSADDPTQRVSVLFRTAAITPESAQLKQVRVFLFCGYLELDLRKVISPEQFRNAPLMVEITTWIGDVRLLVQPGVRRLDHKAFALRFKDTIKPGVLDEEETRSVQVVATTLAFFGDVEFKEMPLSVDSAAAGNGREARNP